MHPSQMTRTSQPAPNVLIQQSPLPPSSMGGGYGGGASMMVSYAGGPPQRNPQPYPAGSPVFATGAASAVLRPGMPMDPQAHPMPMQPGSQVPGLPPNSGMDAAASAQVAGLLSSANWSRDFWASSAAALAAQPIATGLERLDSHSPLMLARLGKVKTQEVINKVADIFSLLSKKELELGSLFATKPENRTQVLLQIRKNVDLVTALLGRLVELCDVLEERGAEAGLPAGFKLSAQAYIHTLMDETKAEVSLGGEEELSSLRRQRDSLKAKLAERDAALAHVSDQLRWAQWEIGASTMPI